MSYSPTDLIINSDKSIYHIALKPEDICPVVITVGDPGRVDLVTSHFTRTIKTIQKREFKSTIGWYGNQKILVISTGIGPDNIDIVLNEIHAIHKAALDRGTIDFSKIRIIRLGTSGSISNDVPVDTVLISNKAIGLDNVPLFYKNPREIRFLESLKKIQPYLVDANEELTNIFSNSFSTGTTLTTPGFYAPQFRNVFLESDFSLEEIPSFFKMQGYDVTNIEMETASIYFYARQFGYEAVSLNAILAHRLEHTFSDRPEKTVQQMIVNALRLIEHL